MLIDFLLQHQAILGKLHANLNEDAVLYMYENTLREIPLFENVEYSFFRAFAKNLKEKYYQKGYMVIRSNEVISAMYIIFRGKVSCVLRFRLVESKILRIKKIFCSLVIRWI